MEVHYGEGVAIHIGPKPCVGSREGDGEASAGECAGQPLSRESKIVPSADVVRITEGNTVGRISASALPGSAWSETLACSETSCKGAGRPRVWPAGGHCRSASGRRGVVADDARTRGV